MLAEGRQAVPAGRLDHVSDGCPSLRRQRHSRLRMAAASQPRELRVPAKFSTARRRSSAGGGKPNRVVLSICPAPGAPGQGAGDAELVSRGTDGVGSCHGLGSLCPLSRDIALTALTSNAGPASGRRPADGAPPSSAAILDQEMAANGKGTLVVGRAPHAAAAAHRGQPQTGSGARRRGDRGGILTSILGVRVGGPRGTADVRGNPQREDAVGGDSSTGGGVSPGRLSPFLGQPVGAVVGRVIDQRQLTPVALAGAAHLGGRAMRGHPNHWMSADVVIKQPVHHLHHTRHRFAV